jgi:hypothetical protein
MALQTPIAKTPLRHMHHDKCQAWPLDVDLLFDRCLGALHQRWRGFRGATNSKDYRAIKTTTRPPKSRALPIERKCVGGVLSPDLEIHRNKLGTDGED